MYIVPIYGKNQGAFVDGSLGW